MGRRDRLDALRALCVASWRAADAQGDGPSVGGSGERVTARCAPDDEQAAAALRGLDLADSGG